MPQHQFSGTGILDGEIVEANQVSQSVDAFTGAKDYRITLTGSLELSGSLLMTGSLINEYTGQFSTLGLGVAAPTAPTMLYIKDTSAGGDPAIVMEATTGNDSARLRLKNPDVEYDVGAFGSSGDDFMVSQDQTSTPKFPFIVGKDTVSYTLYAVDDSVGIGLGASTKALLTPLDAGSLQAAGRVSGSSMRAGIISASAAGENIHGTASYATYIENAQTASYVKAEDVDFYYSISQQVNSGGKIAGLSGSFDALQFNGEPGLAIANQFGTDFSTIISGSADADQGKLYIGDVDGGEYFTFDLNQQFIKVESELFVQDPLTAQYGLNVSGSGPQGTNSIRVGPDTALGTVNAASASLFANDLQFNRNNTSYVSNMNTAGTSRLAFSAGGGSANYAFRVSASRQTEAYGLISATGDSGYTAGVGNISPMLKRGSVNAFSSGDLDDVEYKGGDFSTSSTNTVTVFTFQPASTGALSLNNPNAGSFRIEVKIFGVRNVSTSGRSCTGFLSRNFSYVKFQSDGSSVMDPPLNQSTGVAEFSNYSYNGSNNITSIKLETDDGGADDNIVTLKVSPATSQAIQWRWHARIIRMGGAAF